MGFNVSCNLKSKLKQSFENLIYVHMVVKWSCVKNVIWNGCGSIMWMLQQVGKLQFLPFNFSHKLKIWFLVSMDPTLMFFILKGNTCLLKYQTTTNRYRLYKCSGGYFFSEIHITISLIVMFVCSVVQGQLDGVWQHMQLGKWIGVG